MATLSKPVTTKFTDQEYSDLQRRAADAGLKVGPFIRRETLRSLQVSRETRLVVGSVVRLEEMIVRLFSASVSGDIDAKKIRSIESQVRSVNLDPLVAGILQAEGRKQNGVAL